MAERSRRGPARILAWIGAVVGGVVLLVVLGVLVWSQTGVHQAEPGPLAAVEADEAVTVEEVSGAIILRPSDATPSRTGLVMIPGGKVAAEAYVARMAGLVADEGFTVVITRPWLNLAFFDLRGLDTFTDLAPEVDRWIVGGHSLGGVRACMMTADADALLLLASYCGRDISTSSIPVLSIAGAQDALSTPEKISASADLLPADAVLVEIPGASHASFGDYGTQSGDGTATLAPEAMTDEVTRLVADFVAGW